MVVRETCGDGEDENESNTLGAGGGAGSDAAGRKRYHAAIRSAGWADTLIRSHNRGSISLPAFLSAKASPRSEIVNNPDFALLTVDDAAIFAGVALMEQYNVNATDAAILAVFLRYTQARAPGAPACVLIAADQRLLAAAQAEGLSTLNPETIPVADLPAFLARL
jgi:hypothetical protein